MKLDGKYFKHTTECGNDPLQCLIPLVVKTLKVCVNCKQRERKPGDKKPKNMPSNIIYVYVTWKELTFTGKTLCIDNQCFKLT